MHSTSPRVFLQSVWKPLHTCVLSFLFSFSWVWTVMRCTPGKAVLQEYPPLYILCIVFSHIGIYVRSGPFHSWTFETAAMTTGHIETAAEAEPCSCHRLAVVPVLRISNLCHLKRAACATFQYLSILHTPVFSLWVISLSTSASPYDAPPRFPGSEQFFPTPFRIFVKKSIFLWNYFLDF